jgi:hypothetical protein
MDIVCLYNLSSLKNPISFYSFKAIVVVQDDIFVLIHSLSPIERSR